MSLNEAKEFTTKLFKNSNSLQVCSIYHVRFHWIWETSEIHFLQRSTKSCRRHFRKNKSVWSSIYYYYLHLNIIVDGYCPIRRGGGFSPTYQWQQIVIVYSRRQATQAILLKNGPFQASFFFIFVFSTQLTVNKCSIKVLRMTGFKPRISGVRGDALPTEPQPLLETQVWTWLV